ncbi:hypothetical protein F9L07_13015 [Pimelobacter simplex]|uniref:Uncharacterized protein n=1 Tax=Nocardioides simplex TaxID=2045 RepID=A0A7J5E329_NOCSI|nr:hypothetical protein [Pimelobacter simplex]KAB2812661.1 hypothetical protein F9L07_13015 [Pimelobacter simplex]
MVGTSGAKLVVSPSLTEMVCENFTIAGAVDRPGVLRAHSEPAADVDTFAANRCWAPQWGYVQHDQVGTWKIQVTGDPVGTTWPVVVTDVLFRLAGHTVDCNYDTGGAIGGTFDTATQVFVPTSSSLTLRDVTGSDCATLDLQSGDPVSLTGTWTNVPTAGDGPLSFSH